MSAADIETLFTSITNERGGVSQLNPAQHSLCRALAQALASEPVNPVVVGQLTQLLPPPVKPSGAHVDLRRLSDRDRIGLKGW